MSNSPRLSRSPASVVFFDPPRLSAPKLTRSPRLPRWRIGGEDDDSGGKVFVPLYSPRPPQPERRNHFTPLSEYGDKSVTTLEKNPRCSIAAVLRPVNERIHANTDNPALSIKERLHGQKQRFSRFKLKFLQKLAPNSTSPRPLSPDQTSCPFPFRSGKPGLQVAVVVEKEINENDSSRSRCSQKQGAPQPGGALDSVWVPVALFGLCFGFSAAILLVICWFYSFPAIRRVSELRRPKSS